MNFFRTLALHFFELTGKISLMFEEDEEEDVWDDKEDPDKWDEELLESFSDDLPAKTNQFTRARAKKLQENTESISRPIQPEAGGGIIEALARAIQHHEGWFPPGGMYPKGSKAFRNNNPGNLRYIGQRGSTGKDSTGFAIFPTYGAGWTALLGDLRTKLARNPRLTIRALLNVYAPPSENDTGAYIQAVADELGISPDESLT